MCPSSQSRLSRHDFWGSNCSKDITDRLGAATSRSHRRQTAVLPYYISPHGFCHTSHRQFCDQFRLSSMDGSIKHHQHQHLHHFLTSLSPPSLSLSLISGRPNASEILKTINTGRAQCHDLSKATKDLLSLKDLVVLGGSDQANIVRS